MSKLDRTSFLCACSSGLNVGVAMKSSDSYIAASIFSVASSIADSMKRSLPNGAFVELRIVASKISLSCSCETSPVPTNVTAPIATRSPSWT